jgi:hypothetical protein
MRYPTLTECLSKVEVKTGFGTLGKCTGKFSQHGDIVEVKIEQKTVLTKNITNVTV